jgi:hypothetical protein
MKVKIALFTLFAALIVGCQGPPPTESGTGSSKNTPNPMASTSGVKPSQKPPAGPPVPETLKGDAYHWFGLGNTEPMKVEVKTGSRTITGEQTTRVLQLKGDRAIFEVKRSGELESLFGTETLSLEKGGIYTVKSTEFLGGIHNLEMPEDLTPGRSWDNNGQFKRANGESLIQKLSFKVVGPQKVTTPLGTQDSLFITSTGNMSSSGNRYRMESSFWYVRDKGLVKMVIKMQSLSDKKATPQEITYQETK